MLVLLCLAATLWVVGVRDWRVYGVASLWPPVIDSYQTANLTLPLALLVAIVWRYRDNRWVAGATLGLALALKFFLWPVAIWLVATGRRVAAGVSLASRRVSPPPRPVDRHRRLRSAAAEPQRHVRRPVVHAVRGAARPGCAVGGRTTRHVGRRRGAPRADVAPPEPRAGDRRGARPLADRLASLLRAPAGASRTRDDRGSTSLGDPARLLAGTWAPTTARRGKPHSDLVFAATLLACETGRAAVPGLRDKAAGGRIEASPAPRAS